MYVLTMGLILMDPVTTAALLGLVGKVISVGANLYQSQRSNGSGGLAISADGTSYSYLSGDAPPREFDYLGAGPVEFDLTFVGDEQAVAALDGDWPVVVIIEDLNPISPLESVVEVAPLGGRLEGHLYPSNYSLSAFVFDTLDTDEWDDESLIGGSQVSFDVRPGEPPFDLTVPIESFETPTLFASGMIRKGDIDYYSVELASGYDYEVYVTPEDGRADLDLEILDPRGKTVAVDEDDDSDALCFISARRDGPYEIRISCYDHKTEYILMVSLDE